jgi:hypothetical protein
MSERSVELKDEKGRRVVFANENAKIAWETSVAVEEVLRILGPEEQILNIKPVSFAEEHTHRGLHAIFTAGTVIGTGARNVLMVPDRTLKVREALNIPYKVGF